MVWHRRARKTTMAINELIKRAIAEPAIYWYIAPTYRQAKEIVWKDPQMLFRYLPFEIVKNRNEVELTVYLINGSIISLKGADNPDSLRGMNPRGVIFDEYGDIAGRWGGEMWEAIIQPVLRGNNGWAWFIGTPKGQNHFYKLYQKGLSEAHWQSFLLPASKSGILSAEQLEEARRDTTAEFFAQEYECEWTEGAGQFFRLTDENFHKETIEPAGVFQLGVDLAKINDYTVITPLRLNDFKIGAQERFNQLDWPTQKARIEAQIRRYNNGLTYIDSTGVGEPIYDDLARLGLPVQSYKFTEASREPLLRNLAILLEQKKIKIPDNEILRNELRSFRLELNERGRTIIKSVGEHDDCVMSLALACWGISEPIGETQDMNYNLYNQNYA